MIKYLTNVLKRYWILFFVLTSLLSTGIILLRKQGTQKMEVTQMTKYFIGTETYYIINGESIAEKQIEEERIRKDEQRGYEDRKSHCYDKWYRYNRSDNGKAYDRGVVKFVNEKHSKKWYEEDEVEFRLIECMA